MSTEGHIAYIKCLLRLLVLGPGTGEMLQEKFHLHLPCMCMSVMSINENSCFLQNQLESPGSQSHFVMTVKCGYEWMHLEPREAAEPMAVGMAATIATKLVRPTATTLQARCGAISGFYGFSQSSGQVSCWQQCQAKSALFPVSSASLLPGNFHGRALRSRGFGSLWDLPKLPHLTSLAESPAHGLSSVWALEPWHADKLESVFYLRSE